MSIIRVATGIGNYDLTSEALVLTATPSVAEDKRCQVHVELGDGTDNLDGSGGIFELTLKVGAHRIQPAPQQYEFGISPQASVKTNDFIVPAGQVVKVYIESPNPADTNVYVTAYLFEIPDIVELVIDPEDLQSILITAMSGVTIPNERVVLGPCEQPGAISINRQNGVVSITR